MWRLQLDSGIEFRRGDRVELNTAMNTGWGWCWLWPLPLKQEVTPWLLPDPWSFLVWPFGKLPVVIARHLVLVSFSAVGTQGRYRREPRPPVLFTF